MQRTNFIRKNIENIKGSRKPPIIIEGESRFQSAVKPSQNRQPSLNAPKQNKFSHASSVYKQPTIHNRMSELQKKLSQIQYSSMNSNQSAIIGEIHEIKQDIKMIKSHLLEGGSYHLEKHSSSHAQGKGYNRSPSRNFYEERQTTQSSAGEQENIYNNGNGYGANQNHRHNNRMKSQGSEGSLKQSKVTFMHDMGGVNSNTPSLEEWLHKHSKENNSFTIGKPRLNIKSLNPMIKEYKLESPDFGSIFYGYSKRTSHPVAVKYIESSEQTNHIIEVYDRMWKNIALAKWPCINRLLDVKMLDNNFLVFEKNKTGIQGLPPKNILIDIFRAIEFIHECGYLYRNIEPQHFMLNEEGQLVLVDFSKAKRYVDIKGHVLEVSEGSSFSNREEHLSTFASNSQVRGQLEGRKDDLESLGYFAMLLYGLNIPWYQMPKDQVIKIRSSLTLQDLFQGDPKWIEYMATVIRTNRNDKPDYKRLLTLLESL